MGSLLYGQRDYSQPEEVVFSRVIGDATRHALIYGGGGGLITALLLAIPVRLLLEYLIKTPPQTFIYGNYESPIGLISLCILLSVTLFGLTITLAILSERWQAATRSAQVLTGAGVGALYALTLHTGLLGGVTGIVASRHAMPFLFQLVDTEGADFKLRVAYSTYLAYSEALMTCLIIVGLSTMIGGLLGLLLIRPAPRQATTGLARDAFGSLVAIILPLALTAMTIFNIVILALLDPSIGNMFAEAGQSYPPTVTVFETSILPMMGIQIIIQAVLLLWLWQADPAHLHRSMLWIAQLLYGGIMGALQIPIYMVVNPNIFSWPFVLYPVLSMVPALAFIVIAQWKLRRARRLRFYAQINVGTGHLIRAGWVTLILGWLLADLFVFRQSVNVLTTTISLIAVIGDRSWTTLGGILNEALFANTLNMTITLGLVLAIATVPLALVGWLASVIERRISRKSLPRPPSLP